jgi:hypothetical protein
MDTQMDDEFPILDEENYSTWRIEMKVHLKEIGAGIWKTTIGGSVPLRNKSNFVAQREGKKNDAFALNAIISGLSSSIKESMVQFTSAKDLWLKLEETYQIKKENTKDKSIKNNEGKEYPKSSICNDSKLMMSIKRKILKTILSRLMKVKNLQKPPTAMFQNVMMLNISLQVKKKI